MIRDGLGNHVHSSDLPSHPSISFFSDSDRTLWTKLFPPSLGETGELTFAGIERRFEFSLHSLHLTASFCHLWTRTEIESSCLEKVSCRPLEQPVGKRKRPCSMFPGLHFCGHWNNWFLVRELISHFRPEVWFILYLFEKSFKVRDWNVLNCLR